MLQQGLRFLLVGGLNACLVYASYCLLVIWWHPQLAWLVVYVLGVLVGYYGHSRVVFAVSLGLRKLRAYLLLQLVLFALSSLVIHVATTFAAVGPRVAGALAIMLTVPISFLVSRRILRD